MDFPHQSSQPHFQFQPENIAAYILAGGESRRFDGNTKGLQEFKGYPLIAHCIARLRAQLETVHINTHLPGFEEFDCPLVSDQETHRFQGPLSGLYASMQHMHLHHPEKTWLVLVPCDSPFFPKNLVEVLMQQLHNAKDQGHAYQAACISYQQELQPTFSIWHKDLLPQIKTAVEEQRWGGLKIFLNSLGTASCTVEYPEQARNPFLNINTREELVEAQDL